MLSVDLNLYQFDYDLTFAALLMNADGTVYHRYGSRDGHSASDRLSRTSLVRVLRETLEDHKAYQKNPSPPKVLPKRSIEDIPPKAREIAKRKGEGKHVECQHCHMVNGAEDEYAREQGRFSLEEVRSRWPLPDKVGLKLDRDDQVLVKDVIQGSPAAAAGLKTADRLVRLGSQRIRTHADVQWVLHNTPNEDASVPIDVLREGDMLVMKKLELKKGWKLANELELSWRSSMWGLRPRPGFGGKSLEKSDLEKLGLAPDAFAFRVQYIVDWGDEAYTGENARKAGIKKDDVVLSVGGKKDFVSELHFQSWFRFTQKPGEKVDVELLRDGKRERVELPVLR